MKVVEPCSSIQDSCPHLLVVYLGSEESGGTVRAVSRLAEEWRSSGSRVTHATFSGEIQISTANVEHEDLGRRLTRSAMEHSALTVVRGLSPLFRLLRRVRGVVRDRPGAVVLPFLTGTSLLTLAATIGLPNRIVVCERTDVSRHRVGWHIRLLRRILYRRAAAITINSPNPAAAAMLRKIAGGRPVHFVPNPQPRGIPRADPATSRSILAVGRLEPQKGHATLLDAFAAIAEELPEWNMVILGEGSLRSELETRIEELNLSGRVVLPGQVENPNPYYASAGVFVLPSHYEGTSNALQEAAAAGLPCIVSATAVPPEASDAMPTFDPNDHRALSERLRELCRSPDLRTNLGDRTQRWASKLSDEVIRQAWSAPLGTTAPE